MKPFEEKILSILSTPKTSAEVYNILNEEYLGNNSVEGFLNFLKYCIKGPSFAAVYFAIKNLEDGGYVTSYNRKRHSGARIWQRTGKLKPDTR